MTSKKITIDVDVAAEKDDGSGPWDRHEKQNLVIHWTDEYDVFKFLEVNREVRKEKDNNHVIELMHDISEKGFRPECPIFVCKLPGGTLGILNGQHRFLACRTLGVKFAYLILDQSLKAAVFNVMTDHSLTKGWNMMDFVNFHSQLNNDDYIRIQKFAKENSIETKEVFRLIAVQESETNGAGRIRIGKKLTDKLKRGTIQFRDVQIKFASEIMQRVDRVRYFAANNVRLYSEFNTNPLFVNAVIDLVTNHYYDEKFMLARLAADPGKLKRSSSVLGYLNLLEELHNKGKRPQNKIFLSNPAMEKVRGATTANYLEPGQAPAQTPASSFEAAVN